MLLHPLISEGPVYRTDLDEGNMFLVAESKKNLDKNFIFWVV